jgi:hypothetical protein
MCLNFKNKVHRVRHWYEDFPIQNNVNEGDAISTLLFNLLCNVLLGMSKKPGCTKLSVALQLGAYADDADLW